MRHPVGTGCRGERSQRRYCDQKRYDRDHEDHHLEHEHNAQLTLPSFATIFRRRRLYAILVTFGIAGSDLLNNLDFVPDQAFTPALEARIFYRPKELCVQCQASSLWLRRSASILRQSLFSHGILLAKEVISAQERDGGHLADDAVTTHSSS